MSIERRTYRGRPVTQVVVYGYRHDRGGYRYGYALGHEPGDFICGAHLTVEAAVRFAGRFARRYGVQVTEVSP